MSPLEKDHGFDPDAPNDTGASVFRVARAGGPTVLDVDSDRATVPDALAGIGQKKVTRLHRDSGALEIAAAAGLETYVVDVEAPGWYEPLADRTYDVVLLVGVLERVRDPERLLRDLRERRLVADDGRLVVSFANAAREAVLAELLAGSIPRTRLHWYTVASMTRLLAGCGYLVTETHRTLAPSRPDDTDDTPYEYVLQVRPSAAGPQLADEFDRRRALEHKLAAADVQLEQRRLLLEEERAAFREDISRGADELEGLQGEIARVQAELPPLRGEIARLHGEITGLQDDLAAEREATAAVTQQLKDIQRSRSYRFARRIARIARAALRPVLAIRRRARP